MRVLVLILITKTGLSFSVLRSMFAEEQVSYRGIEFDEFFFEQTTTGLVHCASVCLDKKDCQSFSLQSGTGACRLHDRYFANESSRLKDTLWSYFKCNRGKCQKEGYQWNPDQEICYKFFYIELTVKDALGFCNDEGARLVTIESAEKNIFIKDVIEFYKNSTSVSSFCIYVNAKYNASTMKFLTENNKELSFLPWDENEPFKPDEHSYIRLSCDNFTLWETSTGYAKRYFICEIM